MIMENDIRPPLRCLLMFGIALCIVMAHGQAFGFGAQVAPDSEFGSLKKGARFLGLNASMGIFDSDNPSSVFEDIDKVKRTYYDFNAYGGYFVKDLLAFGGNWNYEFSKNDNGYSGDIDQERIQTVEQFNTVGVLMRNYLPLDEAGRFALFLQTGVDFGYGKAVREVTLANDIDRTVTRSYALDVGLQPGLMVFIEEGAAVEVSVNVLGLSSKWGDYEFNDGERDGNTSSVDLDFTIRVITLYIGISYYF